MLDAVKQDGRGDVVRRLPTTRKRPPAAMAPRSTVSTSAWIISISPSPAQRAAIRGSRSRSSSMTVRRPPCAATASDRTLARTDFHDPLAGPRIDACTMRAMTSSSRRKCWPKRLRVTCSVARGESWCRLTSVPGLHRFWQHASQHAGFASVAHGCKAVIRRGRCTGSGQAGGCEQTPRVGATAAARSSAVPWSTEVRT